jgi:hypothetical protein
LFDRQTDPIEIEQPLFPGALSGDRQVRRVGVAAAREINKITSARQTTHDYPWF